MSIARLLVSVRSSTVWSGLLRDWDRTLRAKNHPPTTRYIYLLAAAQLAELSAAGGSQLGRCG
nr:hypothetical protein GCM10020092_031590 [Actinoplanes digitatis]